MMNDKLAGIGRDLKEDGVNDPVHERAERPRGQGTHIETRVSIRAASPTDGEGLRAMFSRASSETIYRRFHIPYPQVPERLLVLMLDVDHHDTESLVAIANGEIVGHAMYARLRAGDAEMAIVVEDGWQAKGVGKSLLRELAGAAQRRGIAALVGEILLENRRMLGLLGALFTDSGYVISGGVLHFNVPLRMLRPTQPTPILRRAS